MSNQTLGRRSAKGVIRAAIALGLAACAGHQQATVEAGVGAAAPGGHVGEAVTATTTAPGSAEWLTLLPDGEEKRRFVLDCTGCHQIDAQSLRPNGRTRTRDEWHAVIARMLTYAGASTRFPVISAYRDSAATADWLSAHLGADRVAAPRRLAGTAVVGADAVTEFPMPEPRDLPHDVAVDGAGRVVITGMMTNRMYVLDPTTRAMTEVEIPVQRANPRAVEIDPAGNWWVVLGAPNQVARYDPQRREWRTFDVGMYAHSVALSRDGRAWVNGHFTRAPEIIAGVDPASGTVRKYELPAHPTMGSSLGGPIPYEVRVAPDGRVWMSELQGNRLIALNPSTGASTVVVMPESFSGPRRFDVDARGVLWIPAYASNELVRFDPASGAFRRIPLPIRDAVPYVVRVDHGTGVVWIGTSAADAVLSFEPGGGRFTVYELPSRGALVRHLAVDPRTHAVWAAYGASPGIPARVARITPR